MADRSLKIAAPVDSMIVTSVHNPDRSIEHGSPFRALPLPQLRSRELMMLGARELLTIYIYTHSISCQYLENEENMSNIWVTELRRGRNRRR